MMSPQAEQLLAAAMALSEADRRMLADGLFQTTGGFVDAGTEAAWLTEIARREAEIDSGQAKGIPWEEVRQRIVNALPRANESAA